MKNAPRPGDGCTKGHVMSKGHTMFSAAWRAAVKAGVSSPDVVPTDAEVEACVKCEKFFVKGN